MGKTIIRRKIVVVLLYFLCGFIIIFLCLLMIIIINGKIELKVCNICIHDINDLKNIAEMIVNKKYPNVLEYIDFQIICRLYICKSIKFNILKLDNMRIRKMIIKSNIHDLKSGNPEKKQKEKMEKLKKIMPYMCIDNLNFHLSIGVEDAYATAMLTSVLGIITSIILSIFIEDNKNCTYIIKPVYIDKNVFEMNAAIAAGIRIKDLITAMK